MFTEMKTKTAGEPHKCDICGYKIGKRERYMRLVIAQVKRMEVRKWCQHCAHLFSLIDGNFNMRNASDFQAAMSGDWLDDAKEIFREKERPFHGE